MILQLKDIRLTYQASSRSEVFELLKGVDMDVKEGTVTALIGGNGAGKTTLFNIISGFEKDYKGEVWFKGYDITKKPAYEISRKGMGRLFQGRQLMNDLTLMENMKIASDDTMGERPMQSLVSFRKVAQSEARKEQQAINVIKRVFGEDNKYLDRLDHKASELSYGEQRLMAMARLLMGYDSLLLLDEPTSGVHPMYIHAFRSLIRKMVREEDRTVLLIEHNMDFVRRVADECHYLSDGVIIKKGPTDEVLDDPVIRKEYLGL